MDMPKIRIVVPDGSMQKRIEEILANAGLEVKIEKIRTKVGKVDVEWIEIVSFQRPQEIPHYLERGQFDVAIVGQDWNANWGYEFPVLLTLPIGRSGNKPVKIVLAVSQDSAFQKVKDLPEGCEVATEYVQLSQKFFSSKGRPDIVVVPSYGNTEHKIRFGATAIIDVVESGESLRENNLKVICEIMESSVVVVANKKSYANAEKRRYIDCFAQLIKGAYQASKYVMLTANVPKQSLDGARRIIGGLKGPTCSPLTTEGWFALQSVIPRENEQKVIFKLLQIGVTDIIVNRDIPLIMS